MPDPIDVEGSGEGVLAAEKAFVLAMGGYSIELSGASLVTHERALAPRFNYVAVDSVGPERQAAFFERALDHYFQRALRPRILLRTPAASHLDEGFRRFGFRRSMDPVALMASASPAGGARRSGPFTVEALPPSEIGRILPFWGGPAERDELARAFDVLAFHPNPSESFVPLVARGDGTDVSSAILYSDGRVTGLHMATPAPGEDGMEAAIALADHARLNAAATDRLPVGTLSGDRRLVTRLGQIGYRPIGERSEYVLPRDVELDLPRPGPATPPRWRPPRAPAD
ncbi:MAG: hypothetical protein L3J95_00905 [Thermoplasmata archaeon]|nr:hypothetical protein [Thermoplasmata archaeon]MCI4358976.1 hypothetical protein [Thermoplasmata archaeon]